MQIIRATKQYLAGINQLLAKYDIEPIPSSYLGKNDISIIALSNNYEIVGFMWCGVMAGGTLGYIGKFVVDTKYEKQGIGQALSRELANRVISRNIKRVIGYIKHGQYHHNSAVNALKSSMEADITPYTCVYADVDLAKQKL